jgi:hypothetical protein
MFFADVIATHVCVANVVDVVALVPHALFAAK